MRNDLLLASCAGILLSVAAVAFNLSYCRAGSILIFVLFFLFTFLYIRAAKKKKVAFNRNLLIVAGILIVVQLGSYFFFYYRYLFAIENTIFYLAAIFAGWLWCNKRVWVKFLTVLLVIYTIFSYYEATRIFYLIKGESSPEVLNYILDPHRQH